MQIEKPSAWIGASGTEYIYWVYGLEPDVPSRVGNYIYAKHNQDSVWVPVYMGHGDLARRCVDPVLLRTIEALGATHVHLRLNRRPEDALEEWIDLLARYGNAFAPEGCQPEADRPAITTPTVASSTMAASPAGATISNALPDPS